MARHDADFSEYVARRRATLYRTAYLLCGDAHQAEDNGGSLDRDRVAEVVVSGRWQE